MTTTTRTRVRFGKSHVLHWAKLYYGGEWRTFCWRDATSCERDNPDWPDYAEICFKCQQHDDIIKRMGK